MLYIIGLGLSEKDLPLRAISAVKKCKELFLESYTSIFPYTLRELEKIIGKKITTVDRTFVEEAKVLVSLSKKSNVALLIYGDPLIATTHVSLLQEAKKQRVKVEIIHNISVLNAITETGLEAYKFGKATSIPKWKKNYTPSSFVAVLKENLSIGAHTLFLLDLELPLKEAISYLLKVDKKVFTKKTFCVACSCLGTKKQKIIAGSAEKIARQKLPHPVCLIVPAKLHFVEKEYLKKFTVK